MTSTIPTATPWPTRRTGMQTRWCTADGRPFGVASSSRLRTRLPGQSAPIECQRFHPA